MRCEIVYEDQEILVVHKPAGLATQSAVLGQMDMVSELKNYLAKKMREAVARRSDGKSVEPYLGVVHRLDQPVEGLLVFSRTKEAAADLTRQLGKGTLHKKYLAVVLGKPVNRQGSLTDFMRKDKNIACIVTGQEEKYPDAKEAKLQYRVLETIWTDTGISRKEVSLLEIEIETGRFHQIRAQLSHAGFPILGDQKYGSTQSLELAKSLSVRNVALCANTLEIRHPRSGKVLLFAITPSGEIFRSFKV